MLEDLADQQVHDIASQEVYSHKYKSDHLHELVHKVHYNGVAPDSEQKICDEFHTNTLPFLFRVWQRL